MMRQYAPWAYKLLVVLAQWHYECLEERWINDNDNISDAELNNMAILQVLLDPLDRIDIANMALESQIQHRIDKLEELEI